MSILQIISPTRLIRFLAGHGPAGEADRHPALWGLNDHYLRDIGYRRERRGRRLVDGLLEEARDLGLPAWGTALGGMWGLHFTDGPVRSFEDAKAADAQLFARFFHAALRRGSCCRRCGPRGGRRQRS
jgi:hypothetical protein